jgi:DNA adenine methylase
MTKPIIPWIGGKRRLAQRIFQIFPNHSCYVEPFAGGAALYFLREEPAKVEVLNDINSDLVNLYRVVKNHLEEFVRQFKWALSSREVFRWMQMTNPETLTDIQRAARFYYLQQQAFGGKVSGQTWGTATTAPPINLLRIEETLSAAHLRMSQTFVEHLPWEECMRRYDRAHTLFFCDPPYWQTVGYGVDFEWEQYERLAAFMKKAKGKVILTLNDHQDIRECFAAFTTDAVAIDYTVGGGHKAAKRQELIIRNW